MGKLGDVCQKVGVYSEVWVNPGAFMCSVGPRVNSKKYVLSVHAHTQNNACGAR